MAASDPITAALNIGSQLIERIFPDPAQRAEAALKLEQMRQTGELEQVTWNFKDRADARAREVGVKDATNKVLAFVIIGAFVCLVAATLLGLAKVESALAGTLVGYLSAKAEQVLAYYFGSSQGSAQKTELLARAQPIDPLN